MFRRNLWKWYLISFALIFGVAYLFYGRVWVGVLLSPGILFFRRWFLQIENEKTRQIFISEFGEFLQIMETALATGYSLEHAILITRKELEARGRGDSELVRDLCEIERQRSLNISLEKSLLEWAEIRQLEELKFFVQIILAGRRRGGDVNRLIRQTAENLARRMECDAEIRTLLSGKYLEYRVMCLMPIGIITYVKMGSPGYFDAIYESMAGILFMTGCLVVYILAVVLGRKWIYG